jgi:hypothetical protein
MRRNWRGRIAISVISALGMALIAPFVVSVPAYAVPSLRTARCPVTSRSHGLLTVVCPFTGAESIWKVPRGVTSATFDLYGAQGGSQADTAHAFGGGMGGFVQATLAVEPGETFAIFVGGTPTPGGGTGGFNGGGVAAVSSDFLTSAGGGGGGASDVRSGPGDGLGDRLLVAAGGGGNGGDGFSSYYSDNGIWAAGTAGGASGQPGAEPPGGVDNAGGAGTATSGGAGGQGAAYPVYEQPNPSYAPSGTAGTFGVGGTGPSDGSAYGNGGGGGGGYYGGGGGGSAGLCALSPEQCVGDADGGFGGGGGSDYTTPVATQVSVSDGAHQGPGEVVIRFRRNRR